MGRIAEKEVFKPGMKEWVGDGKLIIISMTVSSINDPLGISREWTTSSEKLSVYKKCWWINKQKRDITALYIRSLVRNRGPTSVKFSSKKANIC